MNKLSWICLVVYIAGIRVCIKAADSEENCVVSLIIPKESIKTKCDNNDDYYRTQKLKSIEGQLNDLRRQINDLKVKLTFTLTKSSTQHKESDQEARLSELESVVPEIQNLITNLEDKLSNKIQTESQGNIEKDSQEEGPYSRKKLGRIIKSILRKEMLEFRSEIKEEVLKDIGTQVKKDLRNDIVSYLMKDRKLIHEINSQILLNSIATDTYGMADTRNDEYNTENIYDTSKSALRNDFPEPILSRKYRSEVGNIINEVKMIRLDVLRFQDKQTDLVNSYLQQVQEKINELNTAKESGVNKSDKRIKKLQSESEDTKKKLADMDQTVQVLADGVKSLHENMELNKEKFESDLLSNERNIYAKLKTQSNPSSNELELLKNKTMAMDKDRKVTEAQLRNLLGDVRLKQHIMERDLTRMTISIDSLNATVNPSYEDAFDTSELLHEIDVHNTVKFVKDMKESWPSVVGNISNFELTYNSDITRIKRRLGDIEINLETAYKNNSDTNQIVQKEIDNLEVKVRKMENTMTERALAYNEWAPYDFNYTFYGSGCIGGKRFIKKTGYNVGMYVGVTLCSPTRYKIYLSDSIHEMFLNIGDKFGLGHDHCEFVGSQTNASNVDAFNLLESAIGYRREHWGQTPIKEQLSFFYTTPLWYECGVKIPW